MDLRIFFVLCAFWYIVEPARILGIFPTPAKSHFTLGFRLMKELADRGHEVTMVSPFPQEMPISNYSDIPVESMSEALESFKKDFYSRESMCLVSSVKFIHNMAYELTEKLLSHNNFQNLLKSGRKFDLIVMEYFLNDAAIGVGTFFNAPVVLFSSLPSSALTNHLFANPAPSSYVPHLLSPYTGKMSFWERWSNSLYNTIDILYKHYHMLPKHDYILKKFISSELSIEDVMYNASLMLLNSHPSVSEPVPHTPSMIEIGSFHIDSPKNLSEEFRKFMDEADEGVVLFSMVLTLITKKREAIAKAFGKIKQKVLWKFEDDNFLELPTNLKLANWVPQQDILAHPNTKAFISHGGMLSSIEAVYFGVPVIGIPIYGDQKMNIAKSVQNGYAVSVPFRELTEEKLTWALNEVLSSSKYMNNAKTRSKIMRDQLVSPLDAAIYWMEYVIRQNGATHLQSSGVKLKWYQRNMLDIILVLVVVDVILFLIFYYIFKHIIHHVAGKIRGRPNKKYERLSK
ncbi:hypothetical protein NQ318_011393 [Aromia moschata]|uniref:UDP-glucuronosyltransferase n=1 Tax=Aromia moschata TaxID=1265417 RepID=A0AAV8YRV9_9CUCU|nr:hypothetical protein NQ318_011393 [Aromia moschata]